MMSYPIVADSEADTDSEVECCCGKDGDAIMSNLSRDFRYGLWPLQARFHLQN